MVQRKLATQAHSCSLKARSEHVEEWTREDYNSLLLSASVTQGMDLGVHLLREMLNLVSETPRQLNSCNQSCDCRI